MVSTNAPAKQSVLSGLRGVRIASSDSTGCGWCQSSTRREELSNRDFEFVRITIPESHCNWTRNSRIPGSPNSMVASTFRRAKSGSTKYPSTSLRSFIITKLRRDRVAPGQKTLRWLLQDPNGKKCDLPSDCLIHLRSTLTRDRSQSTSTSYSTYPVLAARIKILVDHMNQHKPVGFRALWRDKRDSNSWYTLWAAVIFGILALILAFAGLAVASAQTWAAFKALDLQKSSTASTFASK
jgi:hypothetical protein